jgi:hypothetical protein
MPSTTRVPALLPQDGQQIDALESQRSEAPHRPDYHSGAIAGDGDPATGRIPNG